MMDSTMETKTPQKAALITAAVIAGAGIAALTTLWLTRRDRDLSLKSLFNRCDEAASRLENRLPLSA